jgi:DNA-binding transcriptional ArsR family regulator
MARRNDSPRFSKSTLKVIAARFRVLGEPGRLALIAALKGGERHVDQLVQATGISRADVSHHLQSLADAGILGRRKAGLHVFFFIADPDIFKLCDSVWDSVQKGLHAQARSMGS